MRTGMCEFCGKVWDPMDHTWFCHHVEPFSVHDPDNGVTYEYDDEWVACSICNVLVLTRNKKALALRTAEHHPGRVPGNLRDLYRVAEMLHTAFFERWQHSHPLHSRRECLINMPNVQ